MSLDKGKLPAFDASAYSIAIVAARFNNELVEALLNDALAAIKAAGVQQKAIRVERVPGSAELPHVCNLLAETNYYDAVIALGVVIAGETPHHEIIGYSTASALQNVSLNTTVPVINGIIVANTRVQAEARTVGDIKRGKEFAESALEMAWRTSLLLDELEESQSQPQSRK